MIQARRLLAPLLVALCLVGLAPAARAQVAVYLNHSSAAEGSHVLKTSGGTLQSVTVTTGASAGYLMIFDATAAPSDGAVTPNGCYSVAATSTYTVTFGSPMMFVNGAVLVFSTGANCVTKAASATAYFQWQRQ